MHGIPETDRPHSQPATKSSSSRLLAGCLILLLAGLGISVWQWLTCTQELEASLLEHARLEENLKAEASRASSLQRELTIAREDLSLARTDLQSQTDRIANLEAQRGHLHAEAERQAERARTVEASLRTLGRELQDARHEALRLAQLPEALQAQLAAATARIEAMESIADQSESLTADLPQARSVLGSSSDGWVFAIDATGLDAASFPLDVLIAKGENFLLSGRLNRIEEGAAIGQVLQWHRSASALVKGEKVFILR